MAEHEARDMPVSPEHQIGQGFRSIVEHASDLIARFDGAGRHLYVNPAVERVTGRSMADLVGRTAGEMGMPDELVPTWTDTLDRVFGTGREEELEVEIPTRHGTRTFLARFVPEWGADGRVGSVLAIARDVTERARAEERNRFLSQASRTLASSLDYHETLGTVAGLAVPILADWCVVDVVEDDGSVRRLAARHALPEKQPIADALLQFPPDMERSQGVPVVLRTGRPLHEADVRPEMLRDVPQSPAHRRVLEALGVSSFMIVPLAARGRILGALSFVASGSGRRYDAGDVLFAGELAGRAALAIDNARLHREAHDAIAMRDEVLSFVSHDLKNPLSVIVNAADLLRERAEDPRRIRRYADMITRATTRMNRLIGDLLAAAQMEKGRFWITPTLCDPARLVKESLELFEPIAHGHGVHLHAVVPDTLPPVRADVRRVLQAIENLLGNALKFTPAGGHVTLHAEPGDGEVRFAVSDSGPGIPEEDMEHLFDRFWQADGVRQGGQGLGLTITRGIVEAHGGRISAESAPGHGTTFRFTLPVATLEDERDAGPGHGGEPLWA